VAFPFSIAGRGASSPLRRIVVTGGPGAGKTAVLELARRDLCEHVEILPEAARIVIGGGFPRRSDGAGRRGAQRAIFHVQSELERMGGAASQVDTLLCDRGTLDGLAYWPGAWDEYFLDLDTTYERELARYDAVIHLRVPEAASGYHTDLVRHETEEQAHSIDARLIEIWAGHPRRVVVEKSADFVCKAQRALALIRSELSCCAPAASR
jgi:predicted ATPase